MWKFSPDLQDVRIGLLIMVLLLSACSSGGSSSGAQQGSTTDGDYSYLYQYNAYRLDGHTVRWPSTTIPVYGATGAGWKTAIRRWMMVRFEFVATKPSSGIQILSYADLGNICGLSSFTYDSVGNMEWCDVQINTLHNEMNCGLVTDTVTHEIGHCIGVLKHTTDGGLMDKRANGSSEITSSAMAMLNLLYSIAPGTDIRGQLLSRRPSKTGAKRYYQPDRNIQYGGVLQSLPRFYENRF